MQRENKYVHATSQPHHTHSPAMSPVASSICNNQLLQAHNKRKVPLTTAGECRGRGVDQDGGPRPYSRPGSDVTKISRELHNGSTRSSMRMGRGSHLFFPGLGPHFSSALRLVITLPTIHPPPLSKVHLKLIGCLEHGQVKLCV